MSPRFVVVVSAVASFLFVSYFRVHALPPDSPTLPSPTTTISAQPLVFGPKTYTRNTGKPDPISNIFCARNPNIPFVLLVKNGDGQAKVTSAVITINGT